ncbi:hypothetical protein BC936DRAFT_148869 [Jimgerdemannia flammicorona]|uniref:G protein-coupled glucose receptor regulating Gpa2-domain-containing protein n=1 Tax=Jimgerdemannia flammicorona TaxID=994334 RepID=A0A433D253_9FUNG|nr:hypothetical protein BC936DRAFT_148869 [Jimgerdemannia flammicorona]
MSSNAAMEFASVQTNTIIATLSGAAVIMLAAVIRRKGTAWRNTPNILVLNLLFADLLQAGVNQTNYVWIINKAPIEGTLCTVSGAWLNFADVSSSLWVFVICIHTYLLVNHNIRFKHIVTVSMVFVWGISFILSVVGFAFEEKGYPFYDNVGAWCWISAHYPVARVALQYGLMIFVAISMFVFYGLILLRIRKNNIWDKKNKVSNSKLSSVARKLFWYPLAYLFLTFLVFLYRVCGYFRVELPYIIIAIGGANFSCLGLVDSLIYGISRGIVKLPGLPSMRTTIDSHSEATNDETGYIKSAVHINVEIEMPTLDGSQITLPQPSYVSELNSSSSKDLLAAV